MPTGRQSGGNRSGRRPAAANERPAPGMSEHTKQAIALHPAQVRKRARESRHGRGPTAIVPRLEILSELACPGWRKSLKQQGRVVDSLLPYTRVIQRTVGVRRIEEVTHQSRFTRLSRPRQHHRSERLRGLLENRRQLTVSVPPLITHHVLLWQPLYQISCSIQANRESNSRFAWISAVANRAVTALERRDNSTKRITFWGGTACLWPLFRHDFANNVHRVLGSPANVSNAASRIDLPSGLSPVGVESRPKYREGFVGIGPGPTAHGLFSELANLNSGAI